MMKQLLLIMTVIFSLTDNVSAKKNSEWVDLGLPSGTLWAACNIGANSPMEIGDLFMWGETESRPLMESASGKPYKFKRVAGYSKYTPYKIYNSSSILLSWGILKEDGTKATSDTIREYLYPEYIDYKIMLDPEDDAATVNWGKKWTMPTGYQFSELLSCKQLERKYVENYQGTGVPGYVITSKINGNSIFLPIDKRFQKIEYFSKTLDVYSPKTHPGYDVSILKVEPEHLYTSKIYRENKCFIRPVMVKKHVDRSVWKRNEPKLYNDKGEEYNVKY